MERLKRMNRWVLIALGALVLSVSAGLIYYGTSQTQAPAAEESELRTATVRRGDLVLLASGSGTVIAYEELELGFGASGLLAELNVQVGDHVQVGEILAVQGEREDLEASVAANQLNVLQAQQALDQLHEQAALTAAQTQLELANAREALEEAQNNWLVQQEGNRATSETLQNAEAELVLAENELARAKTAYEGTLGLDPDDARRASAYARYYDALRNYYTAAGNYNWYTGKPTENQQMALDAELAIAEAQVAILEQEMENLKDGPDPAALALAELQLANAEAKLAVAQRNLEESVLHSPLEGTILSVNAKVGDQVSGPFITIAKLDQTFLELYLDETDLDKLGIGYEVEVIFDAIPDRVFTGEVVQVDPVLVSTGGVSAVRGIVALDEDTLVSSQALKIGMNASVDVIAGQAESALLIPVEALRELSPGEFAVFVLEDGEPQLRMVEVGLVDFTYAQILSGLSAGEVVTTGIVETE
jgi:RND family efflux transporter MFP subunit